MEIREDSVADDKGRSFVATPAGCAPYGAGGIGCQST